MCTCILACVICFPAGSWMKVNGEAIYSTRPWHHQNDTLNGNVWLVVMLSEMLRTKLAFDPVESFSDP